MKKFRMQALSFCVSALLVAAPFTAAWGHEGEHKFEVVLTPVAADGGYMVTLDVAAISLALSFHVGEDSKPVIVGLSGLPEGADGRIDGSQMLIRLVDGTRIKAELKDVILDDQGRVTQVSSKVEVKAYDQPDEPDEPDLHDDDSLHDDDDPDEADEPEEDLPDEDDEHGGSGRSHGSDSDNHGGQEDDDA